MRNPADPRTGPSAGPEAKVTSDRFALRFVKPATKAGQY
jgi:predicted methyltransferase